MAYRKTGPALALAALLSAGTATSSNAAVYLTRSGAADYTIILPEDATPGEQHAARELREHIRQICGIDLSQTTESGKLPADRHYISIGRTTLSREHVSDAELKDLGNDGYRVFGKNGNAFFVGGRVRGSLYAIYEHLESLGVRWYSPDHTVIPKLERIELPSASLQYKPKFWYRAQWWNNAPTLEWLVRMRVNGNNGQTPRIPESMGGCVFPMHGCHSFEILVPAGEYFDKHPDWFATKEDKTRSRGELCLTNPQLRDFVTSRVVGDLRACSGIVDNYWVSQNDGGASGCFCDRCTAERIAHGGRDRWSANIVSFVSTVADSVGREFPNVRIKTLAYNYTKEAPEKMTAPQNVLVELCGNFKAGDDPQTRLVSSWFKVAPNISVYTYGGSNYGYWWPYPNFTELGMQYPRALHSGVNAFYVQGTALGKGSGFADLRAYLTARMVWDPTRDVNKEIRDFCHGFYGPAANHIIEYIDWYTDYVRQHKMVLYEGWGDADAWRAWVNKDTVAKGEQLFQEAVTATANDPVFRNHVRRAYAEVLWAGVMLDLKPTTGTQAVILPAADAAAVRAKAKLFGEIMRENGYDKLAEWLPYVPGDNLIDSAARE